MQSPPPTHHRAAKRKSAYDQSDEAKRQKTENYEWGKPGDREKKKEKKEKEEEPDFGLSGILTKEITEVNGVKLKYFEPNEARKPNKKWRLHVFKEEKEISVIQLHKQSHYLFGRTRAVIHIPLDHPSCSGQHAAIQFRRVPLLDDVGCDTGSFVIKPYIIDLNSTNGTILNGEKIAASRYVELVFQDCIKFGFSSREYVLLYEEAV